MDPSRLKPILTWVACRVVVVVSRFKLVFWPMGKGLSFWSVASIRERGL